jgi:hypothetical protein
MAFFWLGGTALGLDPHAVQIIHIFLWFCHVGVLVITTETRFWPTALALLASFFVASLFPDYRHLAIAFSNLVLTLNAVFLWRAPEKKRLVDRLALPALPVRAPADLLAPFRREDPDGP